MLAPLVPLTSHFTQRSAPVKLGALAIFIVAVAVVVGVLGPDPKPKATRAPGLTALPIAERLPIPTGALRRGSTIATDGDSPGDNTPVWIIRRDGRRGVAARLELSDAQPRKREFSVTLSRTSSRRVLDIGEWTTGPAVFDLRLERRGVRASVTSLGRRARVESRGFARLPRPLVRREVAVATWSGPLPDLFVIDRGGSRERVRITVFSGESGFAVPIATKRAPLRELDPDEWSFEVGKLVGRRPSLVGFSRSGTGTRHPELHVLTGDSGFRRFVVQRPLDRPRYASLPHIVTGLTLGRPGVFLVDRRRLLTVPIAPPQ